MVPNLMIGFGIDQVQAEYVADIRLRNINKEYILKRTQEVDSLEAEIEDLQATVNDPKRIRKIIIGELTEVRKKYAVPRRTDILYEYEAENAQGEEMCIRDSVIAAGHEPDQGGDGGDGHDHWDKDSGHFVGQLGDGGLGGGSLLHQTDHLGQGGVLAHPAGLKGCLLYTSRCV